MIVPRKKAGRPSVPLPQSGLVQGAPCLDQSATAPFMSYVDPAKYSHFRSPIHIYSDVGPTIFSHTNMWSTIHRDPAGVVPQRVVVDVERVDPCMGGANASTYDMYTDTRFLRYSGAQDLYENGRGTHPSPFSLWILRRDPLNILTDSGEKQVQSGEHYYKQNQTSRKSTSRCPLPNLVQCCPLKCNLVHLITR